MRKNIIYAALDVDDQPFHGCVLDPESGESISFRCHPTVKSLSSQLEKFSTLFSKKYVQDLLRSHAHCIYLTAAGF